jgi:hypothetical protein
MNMHQQINQFAAIRHYIDDVQAVVATVANEFTLGEYEDLCSAVENVRTRWIRKREEYRRAKDEATVTEEEAKAIHRYFGKWKPRDLDSWRKL